MSQYSPTLYGALQRIGDKVDHVAQCLCDLEAQLPVYENAISEDREEVLLCYTVGHLQFVPFKQGKKERRYGLLDMGLYNLDGDLNGRYRVVWQPDPEVPPEQLYERPPEYSGPFDEVVEEITPPMLRANSYASYRFDREGGTIFATGPANLLLVPLKNGDRMFQISVCTYVTGGTGVFDNCSGVNTALGSSFVPKGLDVLNVPYYEEIPGVTVSTFRIVRQENIGTPPQGS